MEIWKPIEGYEGIYEISSFGRIKSIERIIINSRGVVHNLKEHILKGEIAHNGYIRVLLYDKKRMAKKHPLHRLVALAFIVNNDPNKNQINHKNHIKTDNRIENLEWCTPSENIRWFFKYGNSQKSREASKRSVRIMIKHTIATQAKKVMQFDLNGNFISEFYSTGEAARETGLKQSRISASAIGKRKTHGNYIWKYLYLENCSLCIVNNLISKTSQICPDLTL